MKRNMKRIISVLMAIVAIVVCMDNYTLCTFRKD